MDRRLGAESGDARTRVAAYGSWSSPITSDMIVASSIGLGEIMLDGADVYWLESRPQEGGRSVLVRRAADGDTGRRDAARAGRWRGLLSTCAPASTNMAAAPIWSTPASSISATTPTSGSIASGRGAAPVAITPEPAVPRGLRYADGVMDAERERMIWVREDHTTGAPRAGQHACRNPARQRAAAARPAIRARLLRRAPPQPGWTRGSPGSNGTTRLMPWIGCELWVGEIAADGSISSKRADRRR